MSLRTLAVTSLAAALACSSASASIRKRPDNADWQKIEAAARLRNIGLAPHRTARFRAFAGYMGLTELREVGPLAPGPCRRALAYLYGNLLDLQDAHPGENWTPLRRVVAREPSIRACAPPHAKQRAPV
jgi:hypothetical protein